MVTGKIPLSEQSKSFNLGVQLWGLGVSYDEMGEWLAHPVIEKEAKEYNLDEMRLGWKYIDKDYEEYMLANPPSQEEVNIDEW